MRKVALVRPRSTRALTTTLGVYIDGSTKEFGRLASLNSGVLKFEEDTHTVELRALHGPSEFCTDITIPEGPFTYCYQIDMLANEDGKYVPRLRPIGMEGKALKPLFDGELDIISEITRVLMDTGIREELRKDPKNSAQVVLAEETYQLYLVYGKEKKLIFEKPYIIKKKGKFVSQKTVDVQNEFFQKEEKRGEILEHMFAIGFSYLPDYERRGKSSLALLSRPKMPTPGGA